MPGDRESRSPCLRHRCAWHAGRHEGHRWSCRCRGWPSARSECLRSFCRRAREGELEDQDGPRPRERLPRPDQCLGRGSAAACPIRDRRKCQHRCRDEDQVTNTAHDCFSVGNRSGSWQRDPAMNSRTRSTAARGGSGTRPKPITLPPASGGDANYGTSLRTSTSLIRRSPLRLHESNRSR